MCVYVCMMCACVRACVHICMCEHIQTESVHVSLVCMWGSLTFTREQDHSSISDRLAQLSGHCMMFTGNNVVSNIDVNCIRVIHGRHTYVQTHTHTHTVGVMHKLTNTNTHTHIRVGKEGGRQR